MPPHREEPSAVGPTPQPASVVVVDDDPGIVDGLSALLRANGFAVEGFTDPAAALVRLRAGPEPSLVLSDCLMPDLTGAELLDALIASGVGAPVVLMTALSDPGFCVDTARVSVLHKPFHIDDLLAEIDVVLRASPPASPPAAAGRAISRSQAPPARAPHRGSAPRPRPGPGSAS